MSEFHQPVMVDETARYLISNPGGTYIDMTCGGGNHLRHFANIVNKNSILVGIDRDPEAIRESGRRLKGVSQEVHLINCRYENFESALIRKGIEKADGFFLDLGVSSHQIDSPERGFSFMTHGPLDMRMEPENELTAEKAINEFSQKELTAIFREYGEEKRASAAARAICKRREIKPIKTTTDLVETLTPVLSAKHMNASLARIFQALRIYVNSEIDQLKKTLPKIEKFLNIGGRIVVLSYHSLEDRVVKNFFREQAKGCICPPQFPVCACGHTASLEILTRKIVVPSERETEENSRSRSAKLRAAKKIA